ncbi:MAG: polysaccharide pyruvyl transferase WcaK-like protein [Motiliproteus sp.]|jgi:polysaccharide pyruvyl transferase WcaK-like protein
MKKAVLINDTTYDYHHGCEAVVAGIKNSLLERGIGVIASCPVGVHFKQDARVLRSMACADIIVVNGEGTIHHGREKAKWLLEVAEFSHSQGIPCALINATYQDNPSSFADLLRQFDLVCVRESLSQRVINDLGVQAEIVPDLTLLLADKYRSSGADRSGVGITDSPMIDISQANYSAALSRNYLFLPVLRSYRREGELSLVELVRHGKFLLSIQGRKTPKVSLSDEAYLDLRNRYIKTTINSYLEALAGLELLLTSRFHSLCFAFVTETPFLAVGGNSHKVESLLKDVGLEHRLVDQAAFMGDVTASQQAFSDEELGKLRTYKQEGLSKISGMFDRCEALIK